MTEEILEQEALLPETPPQDSQRPFWHWLLLVGAILAVLMCVLLFALNNRQSNGATHETTAEEVVSPFTPNPYGPNDFGLSGDYLTYLTGESVLGIDISGFQGDIDWPAVYNAGIRFVMIRVGGRGWGTAGTLYPDDLAPAYYAGAKQAGLQVGAYFFSQAVTPAEAKEEATYALSLMEGWELDMPVVFDWEYISPEARTASVDKRTLTDCVKAFCEEIEAAGKKAMLYTNPNHIENRLFLEELLDYPLWLAFHSQQMTYPYKIDMWQYTAQGSVPGISETVDINLFFPYNN